MALNAQPAPIPHTNPICVHLSFIPTDEASNQKSFSPTAHSTCVHLTTLSLLPIRSKSSCLVVAYSAANTFFFLSIEQRFLAGGSFQKAAHSSSWDKGEGENSSFSVLEIKRSQWKRKEEKRKGKEKKRLVVCMQTDGREQMNPWKEEVISGRLICSCMVISGYYSS